MNARNLICWAAVLSACTMLIWLGHRDPIKYERGWQSPWVKAQKVVQSVPLAPVPKAPPPKKRPPPPPPPQPMSRKDAEDLIGLSQLVNYADVLRPRLQRSIRTSAVLLEDPGQLAHGASRMAGVPDLPANFKWPSYQGTPLTFLAQINLAEVAPHDEDERLPKTGWLYFFYAATREPRPLGNSPNDAGAWKVLHTTGAATDLVPTNPPTGLKEIYPPCYLRFWKEWTLPSLTDEPLPPGSAPGLWGLGDVEDALAGEPRESGWHHLLGHAQSYGGSVRAICELASGGKKVTGYIDPDEPEIAAATERASDWTLLFQIDLSALATAAADPDDPAIVFVGGLDRMYFYIRKDDLQERKFERVWAVRPSYMEPEEEAEVDPNLPSGDNGDGGGDDGDDSGVPVEPSEDY